MFPGSVVIVLHYYAWDNDIWLKLPLTTSTFTEHMCRAEVKRRDGCDWGPTQSLLVSTMYPLLGGVRKPSLDSPHPLLGTTDGHYDAITAHPPNYLRS